MTKYNPPYPVVHPAQMKPRDTIKLVPEEQLDPLIGAELSNLRAGIPYYFTIADTPQNRENFNFKALYFQMVAYKEGWQFKPENLQVVYISAEDPRFSPDGCQKRILEFNEKAANRKVPFENFPHRVSCGGRLGFRVDEKADSVTQMRPEEADDVGEKVRKLFP